MSEIDDGVERSLERFARLVDRRTLLRRAFQTGFATLTVMVFGSVALGQKAYADSTCSCSFFNTCSTCPTGTGGGCPSGACSVCTGDQCIGCGHASGHWSSCGCGTCGFGCRECWDCKCGPNCQIVCGCRSDCSCCGCCSPADIAAELARVRQGTSVSR